MSSRGVLISNSLGISIAAARTKSRGTVLGHVLQSLRAVLLPRGVKVVEELRRKFVARTLWSAVRVPTLPSLEGVLTQRGKLTLFRRCSISVASLASDFVLLFDGLIFPNPHCDNPSAN